MVTKWCYNDTDFDPSQLVFGEKLIKKDRAPKSHKLAFVKNIPSKVDVISENPEELPEPTQNELIDGVPFNEDVNDRKKPKKSSIFGQKLILPQSLLPPSAFSKTQRPQHNTDARKIDKNSQKQKTNDQNSSSDENDFNDEFSFIDTFLNQAKQDPESPPPTNDVGNDENEIIDTGIISDVFTFQNDQTDGDGNTKIENPDEQDNNDAIGAALNKLAKIVRHKGDDGRLSKTIIIQNDPRAHKAFGVKNAPRKFSSEVQQSLSKKSRDEKNAIKNNNNNIRIGHPTSEDKFGAKSISQTDQKHEGEEGRVASNPIISEHNSQHFGISDITEEEREQYR